MPRSKPSARAKPKKAKPAKPKPPPCPTTEYAKAVVAGKIVAGRYVRLACERHLRDLETGGDRGLWFDPEAAETAFAFFGLLNHSKGRWAGQAFVLEPWQKFFIGCLFGWKRADGTRRFRVGHLEVARKNGKTTLAAGIGLLLFILDGEPGAEVYTLATKQPQAKITHEESARMVEASPALKSRIESYKNNLSIPATNSKYEPLAADGGKLDGLNVHGFIADEIHAWKARLLWDVMETASGARSQPLGVVTSTAGFDRHSIWWERREIAIKALEATAPETAGFDDAVFALIYTIDEGDDWKDERCWIKANPSLGVTVKIEDLRADCKSAIDNPAKQNTFKRLKLNMPTEQASRWLSIEKWDACKTELEREEFLAMLAGQPCWAGLDLASTIDLAAFGMVFPMDDGTVCVLVFFWIPGETAEIRAREDRVPYPLWIESEWVFETEGAQIDYDAIRLKIGELGLVYDIREIAFDPWNAAQITTQLAGDGFNVVAFRQGFASMSPPAKELERLLAGRLLRHDGSPCLRWNAGNVARKEDATENIKPDKSASTGRIDGIVTIVMGLGRSTLQPEESGGGMEAW